MTQTPELIVLIGNLHNRVAEAAAKGFTDNCAALTLVHELKDLVDSLEHQATQEYLGAKA